MRHLMKQHAGVLSPHSLRVCARSVATWPPTHQQPTPLSSPLTMRAARAPMKELRTPPRMLEACIAAECELFCLSGAKIGFFVLTLSLERLLLKGPLLNGVWQL